jgi:hypothetical protein
MARRYLHFGSMWPRANDGMWGSRIVHSRDGLNFSYIGGDRGPWASRGTSTGISPLAQARPGSAWDSGMVAMVRGIIMGRDRLVLFKWGDSLTHRQCTSSTPGMGYCATPRRIGSTSGIKRLELRIDGFASASPTASNDGEWPATDADAALLRTVTYTVPTNAELHLNVKVAITAELLVEVLDQSGEPVPNRSRADCVPVIGDFLDTTVVWMVGRTMKRPAISLRFLMKGQVDLFAFWFNSTDPPRMKFDDMQDHAADNKTIGTRSVNAVFHSIVSARLPCVNNACRNSTLDGHVCPCFQLSNSFAGAEIEHWQIRGSGKNSPWPLNGTDPNHCNTTDYPLVCLTPPATIAKALKTMPQGQRTIAPIDLYAPRIERGELIKTAVWDTDANGEIMPFADVWQRVVAQRMDGWFGGFKAEGGQVDVVMLDIESLIFGFGHVFGKGQNNSAIFQPWQKDPRWPQLLAELNAKGAQYGVSFDNMSKAADTACCNSGGCQPGCDTRPQFYYVWNAVMAERVAKMINQSIYEPVAKHFPDVEMSNFDQTHYSSSPKFWAGEYVFTAPFVRACEEVVLQVSSAAM